MRKGNFDMDAAIRRALRESIQAHAHEWEPDFKTGVGPVGDDAPFDKKVCKGKECGEMDEGTIPGDSHEWEPEFKTGVGPVGDDNPFTQAVNESLKDTNDWEEGSFGAPDHKKEGIAYADGADECENGVVSTSQKNSGEVISKDNLSEGFDEEEKDEKQDEGSKDEKQDEGQDEMFGGLRRLAGKAGQAVGNAAQQVGQKVGNTAKQVGQAVGNAYNNVKQEYQQGQAIDKNNQILKQAEKLRQNLLNAQQAYNEFISQNPQAKAVQGREGGKFTAAQTPAQQSVVNGQAPAQPQQQPQATGQPQFALAESVDKEDKVITEERDRFFNIINRIEKLYD